MKEKKKIIIIGAGLAGSEAALQAAKRGINVDLYEMRPEKMTPAHKTGDFAEFVCSNSLGSYDTCNASGLLKHEMEMLGSQLMPIIHEVAVPAGNALSIDRNLFSSKVTQIISNNPNIKVIRKELKDVPTDIPVIIASGPLTSDALSTSIKNMLGQDYLHFFDAIAPIIEKDSIDFNKAFFLNRYNKGSADYINCPMNKQEYENFYNILINSPKIELKSFEKDAKFFESCLPIEVIASRGIDTLRFGPLKPVGLIDPRTGTENYAVVQLRQDNKSASLYNLVGFQTNLKWGAQKELIQAIPGLENANIVRFGVMHRNTFINSPKVLIPTLQVKNIPHIFFAGQITGTEGYTESIASGLLAGINISKYILGQELVELSRETVLGALTHYISGDVQSDFQPINSNWGILAPIDADKKIRKNKKLKNELLAKRALDLLQSISKNV